LIRHDWAGVVGKRSVVSLAGVLLLGAASVGLAGPSVAASDVTGSAFGYQATVSLFGAPQPPIPATPTVALPDGGSTTPITASAPSSSAVAGPATLFSSGQIDLSTEGTPGGTVTSSVKIAGINASKQEAFTADGMTSSCTAAAGGVSGTGTVTNGTLATDSGADAPNAHDEAKVPVPANPGPNTTIEGHIHIGSVQDNFKYVFNEQINNPDGSITVNAAHEYLLGPSGAGDLFVGQVVCSLTGSNPGAITNDTTTTVAPAAAGGSTPGASTGGGNSGMPTTGANVMPLVVVGLELLVVGLAAVRWANRRRAWPLR